MGVILAPAGSGGEAAQVAAAGAREVYLGFRDDAWAERFGAADLNRLSGFGTTANALTFEELLNEVARVRSLEREGEAPAGEPLAIWCTFNSAQYARDQVAWIARRYLPELAVAGATGIIVSGPQLVEAAWACGLRVTASTMCAVYNADIARACRDAGMTRVILPRDMSLAEIESVIAEVPDLEYEAFLMRNGCMFADSHCLGLHRAEEPSLCRTLRSAPWWEVPLSCGSDRLEQRVENGRLYKERFHESACGQCALWRLERAGVSAYKVVGRCDDVASLCEDVALSARNLSIARTCATEADYLEAMERPEGIRALCDDEGLSCYYPEPRFGE